MHADRTILVTGATGRQGGAVARHLLDDGFPVRILARDPGKAAAIELQSRGAEVFKGDMEDPASLQPAVAGAYGVFSVQNYWEKGVGKDGEIRQARHLADAAKAAGVRHFVQASAANVDSAPGLEHFECKWEIEQYIDQIGLPRTFLGEVFYMENFLDPKAGGLMFPVLSGSLAPSTRLHLLSVEDIGAITTVVFQNPDEYIGRKIDIAGDRLSVAEMKETYERVTGKRAKRWSVPSFIVKLGLAEMHRQMMWNNTAGWHFGLEEARSIVPEMTNFEAFLQKHQPTNL
jgi:uncharacterized protein YbjT (DUF2867 family)